MSAWYTGEDDPAHETTVDIGIVVVNYREDATAIAAARQFTELASAGGLRTRTLICDNSETIDVAAAQGIDILMMPNPGYGAAVNAGIASIAAASYLVLTHEVSWQSGDLLDLVHAASRPGVSAVGPVLVRKGSGAVWSSGKLRRGGVPSHRVGLPTERLSVVDALDGACWVVSATAWRAIGPLDEDLFLYWEETDWHARARSLGYRPLVASGVRVSAAPSEDAAATYYLYRNRYIYLSRHVSRVRALALAFTELVFRMPGAYVRYRLWPGTASDPLLHYRFRALLDWIRGRSGPMRDR